MNEQKEPITLESISIQLTRIEKCLDKKEKESKDAKSWKDLQDIGGLLLLGLGLIYLYMTGGFGAIFSWIKNLLLPG